MPLEYIDGVLCMYGDTEFIEWDMNGYNDFYDCCPICLKNFVCKFNDYILNWTGFNGYINKNYELDIDMDNDSPNECQELCTFYKHRIIINYINKYEPNEIYNNVTFNIYQVVPYNSEVTELILEQSIILRWYEKQISKLFGFSIVFPDIDHYFRNILSWDNPWKCEFFDKFTKKTCKDVSRNIIRYINWLI